MEQMLLNIGIFIFFAFLISIASLVFVLHLEKEGELTKFDFFTQKDIDDSRDE